jgi:hypothetical protein
MYTSIKVPEYHCTKCGRVNDKGMLILSHCRIEIYEKDSLELAKMTLKMYEKELESQSLLVLGNKLLIFILQI